ncbi:hypothetical protein BD779DRAFT_309100 [Infundibulicybe gibba]|nr:hypothetical protein BD779DRAFT_309100 [Infundibulicybe gibba]
MSSREDRSTMPAHRDRGSGIADSADATGPEEAIFPTLKKRKYSEIYDASGGVTGANEDIVSATFEHLSTFRLPMAAAISQTDSALSPESGNITPAAHRDRGSHIKDPANTTDTKGATFPVPKKRKYSEHLIASGSTTDWKGYAAPATSTQNQPKPEAGRDPGIWAAPHMFELSNLIFAPSQYTPSPPRTTTPRMSAMYQQMRPPCGPDLMPTIVLIATRLEQGGRLINIGAGANNRLGVLDAAELFSASPASFIKLIASGTVAVEHAVREANNPPDAVADLGALMTPLTPSDVLIGTARSGNMTYVVAGLSHARALGMLTIGFTCITGSALDNPRVCECVVKCNTAPGSGTPLYFMGDWESRKITSVYRPQTSVGVIADYCI